MPPDCHSSASVVSTCRASARSSLLTLVVLGRESRKWPISSALPPRNCSRKAATGRAALTAGASSGAITLSGRSSSGRHESRRRRAAGRERHHLVAGLRHHDGVLPLGGKRAIL